MDSTRKKDKLLANLNYSKLRVSKNKERLV